MISVAQFVVGLCLLLISRKPGTTNTINNNLILVIGLNYIYQSGRSLDYVYIGVQFLIIYNSILPVYKLLQKNIILKHYMIVWPVLIYSCLFVDIYYVRYVLTSLNLITVITQRIVYRDKFKYGVYHQWYAYLIGGFYLIYLILLKAADLLNLYEAHHVIIALATVYHTQLNIFYDSGNSGNSGNIVNGLCNRILFIIASEPR